MSYRTYIFEVSLLRRGLHRYDIRVRGVARSVECADAIAIPRILRQPGIREGRNVWPCLCNLREVRAVVARATLNTEAILVIGVIRPRQIDLSRGDRVPSEIRGSVWRRIRCWRWGRRRCRSWCWCWRRSRSRRWSRRRVTTTAGGELERTDSRAPVELTRRRVILRSKPERTIIRRIDRQR